jgi:hypothetical protein
LYPPTHIAFGYLFARKRLLSLRAARYVWFLAVVTLVPDFVDKGLHYGLGLFASGRNICHNVFILVLLCVGYRMTRARDFSAYIELTLIGFFSHFLADILQSLVKWTYTDYSSTPGWYLYTLFPLSDPPLRSWAIDWINIAWETLIVIGSIAIWVHDGLPGLKRHFQAVPCRNEHR